MMHIELTEKEFSRMLDGMDSEEIIDYLLGEGLSLKASTLDFKNVPDGIYRRERGLDLIRKSSVTTDPEFNWIDQRNGEVPKKNIDWTLTMSNGDWWVQVLNYNNEPVPKGSGFRFQVNIDGERIA